MVILYIPSYDFFADDDVSDTYDFCDALREFDFESEVNDG